MVSQWEEIDHDATSNRRIFKVDEPPSEKSGYYGTYDFDVGARFEVHNESGEVLFKTSGTAKGEYWCGVFLWFVKGSNGRQVRLDEFDSEAGQIFQVPDEPIQKKES